MQKNCSGIYTNRTSTKRFVKNPVFALQEIRDLSFKINVNSNVDIFYIQSHYDTFEFNGSGWKFVQSFMLLIIYLNEIEIKIGTNSRFFYEKFTK